MAAAGGDHQAASPPQGEDAVTGPSPGTRDRLSTSHSACQAPFLLPSFLPSINVHQDRRVQTLREAMGIQWGRRKRGREVIKLARGRGARYREAGVTRSGGFSEEVTTENENKRFLASSRGNSRCKDPAGRRKLWVRLTQRSARLA